MGNTYRKEIFSQNEVVNIRVYKERDLIFEEKIYDIDINMFLLIFLPRKKVLEKQFKKAHKTADDYISVCKQYHTDEEN